MLHSLDNESGWFCKVGEPMNRDRDLSYLMISLNKESFLQVYRLGFQVKHVLEPSCTMEHLPYKTSYPIPQCGHLRQVIMKIVADSFLLHFLLVNIIYENNRSVWLQLHI